MRMLRYTLAFIVVAWLVGEVVVERLAETRIAEQVAESTEDVTRVDAEIDSFPPMARLAFSGSVAKITVTLEDVVRRQLTFAEFRFEFFGLDMDRFALLGGDVKVTDLDEGVLTIRIDADDLAQGLGRTVSLAGADVRVSGSFLFADGLQISIPTDLLPCEPEGRVEDDSIIASCTFTEIPEVIFEEAERFG